MFRHPSNKLSISGRVKQAAQASGEVRSRVSSFVPLAHVLFTIDSLCLVPRRLSCARKGRREGEDGRLPCGS